MSTFRPRCTLVGVNTRVYETRMIRENQGFPVKAVKITRKSVCLNSDEFRSKIPDYDPDELEISFASGENLDVVNSKVLTPDSLDDFQMQSLKSELDLQTNDSQESE